MLIRRDIKNNKEDFLSFNKLSVKVFDLSFEKWYESGYWRDKYFPYTIFDGDKAVANVSISKIHTKVNGQPKLYIQIGTVMTDSEYRKEGLSRMLMEEVLIYWKDKCDGIYLYANDTVLDFYPKFGFEKAKEYQYSKNIKANPHSFIKLDMDKATDREIFESYYNKNNPFSERPMIDNFGLVMFYCGSFMKEYIYYSEELQCIVVADFEDDNMICYDIYCDDNKEMDSILEAVACKNTTKVIFGFMPKYTYGCAVKELENEDQLFVLKYTENMFSKSKMMLPLLSHA